jgi:hypothetical protein
MHQIVISNGATTLSFESLEIIIISLYRKEEDSFKTLNPVAECIPRAYSRSSVFLTLLQLYIF